MGDGRRNEDEGVKEKSTRFAQLPCRQTSGILFRADVEVVLAGVLVVNGAHGFVVIAVLPVFVRDGVPVRWTRHETAGDTPEYPISR